MYAWIEGEDFDANHIYETMTCTACQRVHLVNSKTGRVVGDNEAPKRPLWPPLGV